jgi:hypothetical protein
VRQQNACGDTLLNYKAFCADISDKAGVRKGNQGYLLGEVDFDDRISIANHEELQRDELREVMSLVRAHTLPPLPTDAKRPHPRPCFTSPCVPHPPIASLMLG